MVTIDKQSGFCFGVVTAIRKAEEELQKAGTLYCLGDIVHNRQEVERLEQAGLKTINYEQFQQLRNANVLLRAHGEPPQTYKIANNNDIQVIDATCPVVRNLQQRIRKTYLNNPQAQIVIFGKKGHAEVIGLEGQTDNTAIVVETLADLNQLDYNRDIYLFSQTTKSVEEFGQIVEYIEQQRKQSQTISNNSQLPTFEWHDTICGQVRNRVKHIREFAAAYDKIVFVSGKNSSNGKVLYAHCKQANNDTIFISDASELTPDYIASCKGKTVGICGATSTPLWLMQQCQTKIERYNYGIRN